MEVPNNINDTVETLARLRDIIDAKKASLVKAENELNEAIRENERLQAMIADIEKRKEEINQLWIFGGDLESHIRARALDAYMSEGVRKPATGVEVKIFKVARVTDERGAKIWCSINAPDLLKLDMRGLTKAIENLQLDFASIVNDPRVQISSNLKAETGDKT